MSARAGRLLRVAVAVVLTAIVLWQSDPPAVVRAAAGAELGPIAIAVALVVADRALMAYRWILLLCPLESTSRPPFGVLLRIFFVSTFVGTFLPASIGGDAVRAYSLSRQNVAGPEALASVLMDRLLGVLSILLLGAVALAPARRLVADGFVLGALAATAAACAVAAAAVFSTRAAALGNGLLARMPLAGVQRLGRALIDAVQRYAGYRRQLVNVLLCSVGVQVLRVVQAYFLGRALGIETPLALYFAFIPLILLVMLLPVTVNGIGTSQAAFVWFFERADVARADAFALSVLFVALGIVGNLPGGILYAARGTAATPPKPSAPAAPAGR